MLIPRRQIVASVSGHPWGTGQQIPVTMELRDPATMELIDPDAIIQVDLVGRDRITIVETVDGGDVTTTGPGNYRAAFDAVLTAGTYYLRIVFRLDAGGQPSTWVESIEIEDLTRIPVAGVMSIDELFDEFLGRFAGEGQARELLRGDDGEQLMGDAAIEAAIRQQAAYVERFVNVNLRLRRYACRPDVVRDGSAPLVRGVDYDEEIDPQDFDALHSGMAHGHIDLPHTHIQRITRARLIYGRTVLWDLPTRWFQIRSRQGMAYLVVDSVSTDQNGGSVAFSAIFAIVRSWITSAPRVPMVWAIDYEAGLLDFHRHEDLRAVIGWRAVSQLLALAAVKANKQAVSSQSRGKDGLNASMSVADTAPGGRFSRLLDAQIMKDWTSDDTLRRLRRQLRPGIRVH